MIPVIRIVSPFIYCFFYDRCAISYRILSRAHSIKTMANHQWAKPKELLIPVPYGHIAAKVWGSEHSEPVLALHGWQDNAGTFDRLIPLLSSKLQIVAIDAPGHGLSSHKPRGALYHFMEMVVDIRRVVNYLNWDHFNFIGHSLGGTIALMYASVYPETIKNIVLLDIIKPTSRAFHHLPGVTRSCIDSILKIEAKFSDVPPIYTMQEAHNRLIDGTFKEITPESADILLKRGCFPSRCGKGVVFSKDFRVRGTEELQKFSHDDLKAFMRRIKSNMLIVIGNQSSVFKYSTPEVLDDFLDIYKENCKSLKVIKLDGNHFVHLNSPNLVAPHVDAFFKQHLGYFSNL